MAAGLKDIFDDEFGDIWDGPSNRVVKFTTGDILHAVVAEFPLHFEVERFRAGVPRFRAWIDCFLLDVVELECRTRVRWVNGRYSRCIGSHILAI
ncbi:hypothetical protein MBEHAL_2529 [Halarchaeum acidiphilum MH1-52-1]|uniref:Uncharacterized protein n=1 Tax=Halarchaeum acidiphilum MH1-52-1 TaxID=1261545 RepID=U3A7W4_9EURY|nr:hypothetical protein MBEHAL_2529 [Halarchaeum acidiphilum MH1-52-1]